MKKKCRICSGKIISILNFKKVALSGSFLKKENIIKEKKYKLSAGVCENCKHFQIENLVNPKKLFSHYIWETGVSKKNIELIIDKSYHLHFQMLYYFVYLSAVRSFE